MKGLDLSKFKKVSEDQKSTTLLHPDGHKIVIAVHSLSPKIREELKKLPHEKGMKEELKHLPHEPGYTKKMAQGGGVKMMDRGGLPADAPDAAMVTDMDPNSPEPSPEDLGQNARNVPSYNPVSADKDPSGYEPNIPTAPMEQPAPNTPAPAPIAPAPPIAPPPEEPPQLTPQQAEPLPLTPEQHKQAVFQELQNHSNLYGVDLANGHITPQTYSDLMYKNADGSSKGFWGSLGSITGMLMSGMGSGLSGQPNALMAIMDKQIERDIEAQKTSASNAQNFVQLGIKHQEMLAAIAKQNADTKLTEAMTAKVPEEAARLRAEAAQMHQSANKLGQEAKLVGTEVGANTATQTAYHHAINTPNMDPLTKTMLTDRVAGKIVDSNDRLAGMLALPSVINDANGSQDPEAKWQREQKGFRSDPDPKWHEFAEQRESHHMPGIIGESTLPLSTENRDNITNSKKLNGAIKALLDFTNRYKNFANIKDPKKIPGYIEDRAKILPTLNFVHTTLQKTSYGGVSRQGERDAINEVVPDPRKMTDFLPDMGTIPKLQGLMDLNNKNNNDSMTALGFPDQSGQKQWQRTDLHNKPQQNQTSQPAAQPKYKIDADGIKWKRGENGEAVKVK